MPASLYRDLYQVKGKLSKEEQEYNRPCLTALASDALFRKLLRKYVQDRQYTPEELERAREAKRPRPKCEPKPPAKDTNLASVLRDELDKDLAPKPKPPKRPWFEDPKPATITIEEEIRLLYGPNATAADALNIGTDKMRWWLKVFKPETAKTLPPGAGTESIFAAARSCGWDDSRFLAHLKHLTEKGMK